MQTQLQQLWQIKKATEQVTEMPFYGLSAYICVYVCALKCGSTYVWVQFFCVHMCLRIPVRKYTPVRNCVTVNWFTCDFKWKTRQKKRKKKKIETGTEGIRKRNEETKKEQTKKERKEKQKFADNRELSE